MAKAPPIPVVTAQAPPSTTQQDKYGLGYWQDKPVYVGGLFPVAADPNGHVTADQVVDGFTRLDPAVLAGIQRDMLLAGFYPSTFTPQFGVVRQEDIKAFGEATKVAAETGTPLDSYLHSAAQFGQQQGGQAGQVNFETMTHEIRQTDPATLHQTLDRAFQQALGRKASDGEKAAFAAAFNTRDVGAQQAGFNAADNARGAYVGRQQAALDAKAGDPSALAGLTGQQLLGQPDSYSAPNPRLASEDRHDTVAASDVTNYANALAQKYGLKVTSQFRTQQQAAALGHPGDDHTRGMAVDLSGDPRQMRSLYEWAQANAGPGRLFRYVEPWDQAMATNAGNTGPHVHLSFNDRIDITRAPDVGTVAGMQPFQTRTGAGGAGGNVASVVTQIANELGVDPHLALSIAQQESGLNPRQVGDQGTSFGLFQLHKGGELGSLTPEQAYDPATNARVALTVVAQIQRQHPDWSPGQIAAAAQRPKDPVGYARSVNSIYASGPTSAGDGAYGTAGGPAIPISQTITTTPPDLSADAIETARTQHPVEAGAHDIANTYNDFLSIIGAAR